MKTILEISSYKFVFPDSTKAMKVMELLSKALPVNHGDYAVRDNGHYGFDYEVTEMPRMEARIMTAADRIRVKPGQRTPRESKAKSLPGPTLLLEDRD